MGRELTSRRIDQHENSTLSLLLIHNLPSLEKSRTDILIAPNVRDASWIGQGRVQLLHLSPDRFDIEALESIDQILGISGFVGASCV